MKRESWRMACVFGGSHLYYTSTLQVKFVESGIGIGKSRTPAVPEETCALGFAWSVSWRGERYT